nr:hypothetical protein [Candidatus Sigynarchaeota archaeon]
MPAGRRSTSRLPDPLAGSPAASHFNESTNYFSRSMSMFSTVTV